MSKCFSGLLAGLAIGVYLGMTKEEELDRCCYQAKRAKKNIMRRIERWQDEI